jgi:hypothetical protein
MGLAIGMRHGPSDWRLLMAGIAISSVICFIFYTFMRSQIDRNYGGVSICFRWMLWFAPLWLVSMTPALVRAADIPRWRMAIQGLLLASVFSMSASLANPWQSPWIYRYFEFLGWFRDTSAQ